MITDSRGIAQRRNENSDNEAVKPCVGRKELRDLVEEHAGDGRSGFCLMGPTLIY